MPGSMATTRTPVPCDSACSDSDRRPIACLLAPYIARPGRPGNRAPYVERFTITPEPWPRMCGSTARISRNGAQKLVSHTARSEEHTSELQSLRHLVCRLLLE